MPTPGLEVSELAAVLRCHMRVTKPCERRLSTFVGFGKSKASVKWVPWTDGCGVDDPAPGPPEVAMAIAIRRLPTKPVTFQSDSNIKLRNRNVTWRVVPI